MDGNLKLNAINVVCDVITFAILSGEKQPLNQSDTKLELTKKPSQEPVRSLHAESNVLTELCLGNCRMQIL